MLTEASCLLTFFLYLEWASDKNRFLFVRGHDVDMTLKRARDNEEIIITHCVVFMHSLF